MDGFIELWDCDTCKLRKDLDYQMKDELMMHDEVREGGNRQYDSKDQSRIG